MTFSKSKVVLGPGVVATDDPSTGDVTVTSQPDQPARGVCPLCKKTVVGAWLSGTWLPRRGSAHAETCPNAAYFDEQSRLLPDVEELVREQRILQKIDFVWGNLAASSNHQPASKDAVAAVVWREEWAKLQAKLEELRAQVESIRQTLGRL